MIVLLHGVPETADIWDDVRAQLNDESVALRLPGFGSARPDGFGATKDDYAAWVANEIKQARQQANEIIERAQGQANQIVDKARAEAVTEANRLKAAAAEEIASMQQRAREELRGWVGRLAVQGAEKIVQREIDASAHKAMLDQLVAEI